MKIYFVDFCKKMFSKIICSTCVISENAVTMYCTNVKPPILTFFELYNFYMLAIHFYQNRTSCLIPINTVLYCNFRVPSYKHIYFTLSTNFTSQIVMINSNIVVKCSWNCTLSYCLFIYIFIYIYILRFKTVQVVYFLYLINKSERYTLNTVIFFHSLYCT